MFYSPISDENAITFDGQYFIVNDWNHTSPTFYRIDHNGTIIDSFDYDNTEGSIYRVVQSPSQRTKQNLVLLKGHCTNITILYFKVFTYSPALKGFLSLSFIDAKI